MSAASPGAEARGSALYVGTVMHRRLRPRSHHLRYRVYHLLIDIDELDALSRRLRLFSVGRFNLFSVHPKDHGDGSGADLRAQTEARLRAAGLPVGGAIRLLTMPRVLGHAFNPLSVWFCDAPNGVLQAIVYEVNNTFGERHSYLIPVVDAGTPVIAQACEKAMYVSPFISTEMSYRFRVEPPAARLSVGVSVHDVDGVLLNTRLDAERRPLSDASLLRVFASHPLVTLKVVAAIHWEALRLWLKGTPLQARPRAPADTLTIVLPCEKP